MVQINLNKKAQYAMGIFTSLSDPPHPQVNDFCITQHTNQRDKMCDNILTIAWLEHVMFKLW